MRRKKYFDLPVYAVASVIVALCGLGYVVGASAAQRQNVSHLMMHQFQYTTTSGEGSQQVRKEHRCTGCRHDARIIRRWSAKHYSSTYAGTYFELRNIVYVVVGFTSRQRSLLRAIRQLPGLTAPERVLGFQVDPRYSLRELNAFEQRITEDVVMDDNYSDLIIGMEVAIRLNRVDVRTEHVERVKARFEELYGPEAPFGVQYEEAPVEL